MKHILTYYEWQRLSDEQRAKLEMLKAEKKIVILPIDSMNCLIYTKEQP